MEEIKNDIIKKYKYKNYVIYIKETEDSYESYLQNEDYGVISLMFGISKEQVFNKVHKYYTLIPFINLIEKNIEDYILTYKIDYED